MRSSGLVLVLLWTSACGAAQDLDASTRDKAEGMTKALINWGPKMNTPGVNVWLDETGHGRVEGHSFVKYEIYASGLINGHVYTLLSWDIGEPQPKAVLEGVTLDNTGRAICAGRRDTCGSADKPNDPVELILVGAEGEPKRLALISQDGKEKGFTSIVPFPIAVSDHACSLSAILGLRDAELVLLRGTGFTPNVQVEIDYSSSGEHKTLIAKTTGEGSYDQVVLPFVKGTSVGTASVRFITATCSPSLTFQWGKGTYHTQ
jgi:hypothetical protein